MSFLFSVQEKLFFVCLIFIFSLSSVFADPTHGDWLSQQHSKFGSTWLVTSKIFQRNYPNIFFNIDKAVIPQITGHNLSPGAKHFNQRIANLDLMKNFYFSGPTGSMSDVKNNEMSAATDKIWTTMTVTSQVTFASPQVISVRLKTVSYSTGAAHPNTGYYSLNYDLKNDKILSLKNLFKPHTPYLSDLAHYAIPHLTRQFSTDMSSGAKPIAENYTTWNITPKGLLISYNEFAHVFGEVAVLVPYANLKICYECQ